MNTENKRITIGTVVDFLFGSRDAILALAAAPYAVLLGAVFVLSAGLARDYDGAYLRAEPFWLAVPFAASLATSFFLYSIVVLVGIRSRESFWRTYRSFLALYWLTAPLAWLYAVPVERFLSARDAALANIIFLAVVSFWRVCLMTRVVNVLFEAPKLHALWVVLFFADTVAIALVFMAPVPVIQMMGGVRLSDREAIIQAVALKLGFFAIVTWLVWFVGVAMIGAGRRRWTVGPWRKSSTRQISAGLWAVAVASVLAWLLVLPTTQAEQRLSWEVENAYEKGRLDSVVEQMSRHGQANFPPHWDPPPRLAYGDPDADLYKMLVPVSRASVAAWVREVYAEKVESALYNATWPSFNNPPSKGLLVFLSTTPEGQKLLETYKGDLGVHLDILDRDAGPESIEYREKLEALLDRVEQGDFQEKHATDE